MVADTQALVIGAEACARKWMYVLPYCPCIALVCQMYLSTGVGRLTSTCNLRDLVQSSENNLYNS